VREGIKGALNGDTDTAVTFDGSPSTFVNATRTFDFAAHAPFTVEAWVRLEQPIGAEFETIVGRQDVAWGLFVQSETLRFVRADTSQNQDLVPYDAGPLHGQFKHVVGTFDGATMHLYVDGVEIGATVSNNTIAENEDPLKIGQYLPATLDEVAIYDHALSPDRIAAHHQIGVGP
jgi:hypothetical protein